MTYNKLAPIAAKSPYDGALGKVYSALLPQVAEGTVDINTALRDAEDASNKAITQARQSK